MQETVTHNRQTIYPFSIPQPPVACEILNEAGQIVTSGTLEKGFCKETLKLSRRLPVGTYLVKPITLRLVYRYDIFSHRYTLEQSEVPVQIVRINNPLEKTFTIRNKRG